MTTRRDPEGRTPGYFNREQAIDLETAIAIFTRNGAYAMRLERETGSIEAGKFADMIVLDRNLFEIRPDRIGDTQVLLTLLGGKAVYESDELSVAATAFGDVRPGALGRFVCHPRANRRRTIK